MRQLKKKKNYKVIAMIKVTITSTTRKSKWIFKEYKVDLKLI